MKNNKSTPLSFSGTQTLQEAAGIQEKILEYVRNNSEWVFDFAGITEVDLTLVQLIESARISAAGEGKSIRLSSPASGALLTVLERGGFLGERDDPRTQFWLAA